MVLHARWRGLHGADTGEQADVHHRERSRHRDPPDKLRTSRRRRRSTLVASYAATAFFLVTLNFALPRVLPGDPIDVLFDADSPSHVQNEAVRAELSAYYGLDRPLWKQYGDYLGGLATGDLGVSIRSNVPVADLVGERLPWTALLIASAMIPAVAFGWLAGAHAAWRRGRRSDRGLLVVFLGVNAFPVFFVGSLALFAFSVKLGWFPLAGARTPFLDAAGMDAVLDVARHLVLPASVLGLNFVTSQFVEMRASMVGELGADYLRAGRAKGLAERRLKYRYAARNALLPVVTLAAVHMGFAVTQSVLVETVFAYQGIGRLMFESISFRDYPTMQACFLVLTMVVLTANLAADLLNTRLDPRITA